MFEYALYGNCDNVYEWISDLSICNCMSNSGTEIAMSENHFQISLCVPPKLPSYAKIERESIRGAYAPGTILIECETGYRYKGDNLQCDPETTVISGEVGKCIVDVVSFTSKYKHLHKLLLTVVPREV